MAKQTLEKIFEGRVSLFILISDKKSSFKDRNNKIHTVVYDGANNDNPQITSYNNKNPEYKSKDSKLRRHNS